jgi:long-chain fatty acid transport protein
MKKITLTALSLALLYGGDALAAGYQLNEYSTTGLGRSFAGAGVVGDDYSALAYNPAGMTLVKRSGMQLGFTEAEMYSDVKSDTSFDKTKMHYGVSLPSGFGQWNVNDKLFVGAGVYVPFGLSTKHKEGSFVAGTARDTELEVVDSAVAAAYKATDKLSLGVTGIYRYIHGNMTQNVVSNNVKWGEADYDLDGWTMTGIVGAVYEFTPDTRLGISYKMKSKQTVKGNYTFDVSAFNSPVFDDGRASPDLPASVLISGYHKATEKLGLSASARWTQWSVFDKFTMTAPSGVDAGIPGSYATQDYSWRDSWTFSLGADYYINDNWTWRVGTAYDQTPTKDKEHRTNRIPDVNRIWLSTGASYTNGNWQLDAGIAHLFMSKGHVDNSVNTSMTPAEYSSYSNMYSLNLQYKF